ncbi:uncharacterized protein [Apostichopus japonicus]|uniref:uncharacterized protein isoform X3 n=1 Tax=Stichopus japonicus TaxID=307972 RepID=UPI003AB89092
MELIPILRKASMFHIVYLVITFLNLCLAQADVTPYQPECQSLDNVISEINQNIAEVPGSSADCVKFADCTGAQCRLTLMGKIITCNIKLFPCDDPPQMRILVTGNGINFEQTVTQDSTYLIPGLTYSPFPVFSSSVDVEIVVQFEPQDDGIVVGMDIQAVNFPIRFTLFHDVLIQTPPCTSDAHKQDCSAMEVLAESIPPPRTCSRKVNCNGIDCEDTILYSVNGGPVMFPVTVKSGLEVDSCSNPVSLIASAQSSALNLDWTQVFTHSEVVHVDQDLSMGIDLSINVTMELQPDLEHILTTITYKVTKDGHQSNEVLLENASVPIPECRVQPGPPTVTETPPAKDECESWQQIEDSLEFNLEGGYSLDDCVTLSGCRGFNCTATYMDQVYQVVIEEFHCEDPTYVMISVDGPDEHYSQNFTHNETALIPGTDDVTLVIHLVQESATTVFIGAYIIIVEPETGPIRISLIDDQILELTECDGGGVMQASSTIPATGVTHRATTLKSDQAFSASGDSRRKASNTPVINPVGRNEGLGMTWTIVLGIASAILLAAVVILIALFLRLRRRSPDLDILMETTDDVSSDAYAT